MIISTYGLPGSGKTSSSRLIAQRLGLKYVGAGDIARTLAETDEETRFELSQGRIAPPAKMRAAMLEHIQPDTVLDGYPRYFEQLADLWYNARPMRDQVLISVVFACDTRDAAMRLLMRRREDDQEEQIAQRMTNYREQTLQVITYLLTHHTDTTIFIPQQACAHDSSKMACDYIEDNWL